VSRQGTAQTLLLRVGWLETLDVSKILGASRCALIEHEILATDHGHADALEI